MRSFFITMSIIPVVVVTTSWAEAQQRFGTVYASEGTVEVKNAASPEWRPVELKAQVNVGDTLRTGPASRIAILGDDGLMIRLRPDSLLEINKPPGALDADLKLDKGATHVLARDPHTVKKVTTTLVSGSIRGTEFVVEAKPDTSSITVIEGALALNGKGDEAIIGGGKEVTVDKTGNAVTRVSPKVFDSVQWAVRYPTLVSIKSLSPLFTGTGGEELRAFEAVTREDSNSARAILQNRPASPARSLLLALCYWLDGDAARALEAYGATRNHSSDLVRAGLLLEVGEVERARAELDNFERRSNGASVNGSLAGLYHAQRAVLAVLNGGKDAARSALAASGGDATPEIAYARSVLTQSSGDVEGALKEIEAALTQEPNNARLLARQAELLFGMGENRRAEEVSRRAIEANPRDLDAQTVRGFILVSRGKHEEARKIFESLTGNGVNRAAAYLGMGLVTMIEGDRDEARLHIQKAVQLEPTSSLYRSYLAKAFFETERERDSERDLELAKKLDPLDPTPHLYEAFTKLALFQPVAALSAVEESIALNDNRAVYRSRLLLDQDAATRASGLGRVFAALDFTTPARIEALKSLADDPSNYAAHFLLKDSFVGTASNTASTVEEVVGTLLAPANFSSLLPSVSGAATLNDYSTLFEREESRNAVEAVTETHNSAVTTSTVHFAGGPNYSYLLRYGFDYADGSRRNDYTRTHNARVMTQYAPTADDKILAEGILVASELGDTSVGLDPEANDPAVSYDFDDVNARLGYRRRWSSSHTTLAQGLYISNKYGARDKERERILEFSERVDGVETGRFDTEALFDSTDRRKIEGGRVDAQHIWSGEELSLVAGGNFTDLSEHQREGSAFIDDSSGIVDQFDLSSRGDVDTSAARGYGYLTLRPTSNVSLVGGAQYGNIEYALSPFGSPFSDESLRESAWLPKAGIFVTPGGGFTLRSAYFETLGMSSDRELEGLEPVQVGGIRQVFDDAIGAETQNWGVGIDWKSPTQTYLGTELLYRNVREPFAVSDVLFVLDSASPTVGAEQSADLFTLHTQERVVSSYWNQVLSKTLVSSVEHEWAQTDADSYEQQARTHRVRAGLNYFQSDGFYAFTSATWRYQSRDNFTNDDDPTSDFWIASGGVGYQLEHRRGFVQLALKNILDQDYRYVPIASDEGLTSGINLQLDLHVNF